MSETVANVSTHAIILAGGRGTRMRTATHKVLQPIAGRPMLAHLIETVQKLPIDEIRIVENNNHHPLKAAMSKHLDGSSPIPIHWVDQGSPQGTGHAVQKALAHQSDLKPERVLILMGDIPLIPPHTLNTLIEETPKAAIGIVTGHFEDPSYLGRILRNPSGDIIDIVEEKDATSQQKNIQEIFTGVLLAPLDQLTYSISRLTNDNQQKEYYLTGIIPLAAQNKTHIYSVSEINPLLARGVNTLKDLSMLERLYQSQTADHLMQQGVRFADPSRFDLRGTLEVGQNVFIDTNVTIEGNTHIADNVNIGPNVVLRHVRLKSHVNIYANCVIEHAVIEPHCQVGPFAHLRNDTYLQAGSEIGNFVEVKNSTIGAGSKAKHLSYLGDAKLGENITFGAGSITCNYNGKQKQQTLIESGAFIGSDCQLIAPVKIGKDALIGAGSTITKDVPPETLALSRAQQRVIRRKLKRLKKSEDEEAVKSK